MATLTEMVAALVVQSSAVAFSHFGVTVEASQIEAKAHAEAPRTVARSPRRAPEAAARTARIEGASACPDAQRIHVQAA